MSPKITDDFIRYSAWWESTTSCFKKWVTHKQYLSFSDSVKAWYKPSCPHCSDHYRREKLKNSVIDESETEEEDNRSLFHFCAQFSLNTGIVTYIDGTIIMTDKSLSDKGWYNDLKTRISPEYADKLTILSLTKIS